jgi:ParB family chromosome partitioning protein
MDCKSLIGNTIYYHEEEIDIDKIDRPCTILREIDEEFITELMRSIKSVGLLQPILVRCVGDRYVTIFGNHRLEACKRLGWKKIKALVANVSPEEAFLLQVVENIQRNVKINVVAEAEGYKRLIERGWTLKEIAEKIGKSDKYVSARVRIIEKLHPEILKKLSQKEYKHLTASHAEQIALINDKKKQLELARIVEERKISVRKLEKIIQSSLQEQNLQYSSEENSSEINRLFKFLDGKIFIDGFRAGIIMEAPLNAIIDTFFKKRIEKIAWKFGKIMRNILLNLKAFEEHSITYKHNLLGLGKIELDNEKVTIKDPLIKNPSFMKSYLEGLLNIKLIDSLNEGTILTFYFKPSKNG